jgi:exopolysaccharide biosynthesis polyprenyl glycosylphosphotransferase
MSEPVVDVRRDTERRPTGAPRSTRIDAPEAPPRIVVPDRGPPPVAEESERRAGPAREQFRLLYVCMAITDVVCVTLAFDLAALYLVRRQRESFDGWAILVIAPIVVLVVFSAFRLYSAHQLASAEEFRRVLLAVTLVVTSSVTLFVWSETSFTRLWIVLSWLLAIVLALANRYGWRRFMRHARGRGRLILRTLIVGVNDEAGRVATAMAGHAEGFVPVGYVCADQWGRPTMDIPMVGHLDDLERLIDDYRVDCLFVAATGVNADHVARVSKAARRTGIEVRVTAVLQDVLSTRITPQPLGGVMALGLRPVRLSGVQALAKRVFDIAVTLVLGVLLLPAFVVIAVAVKLTSSGSVFFTQERVGLRGRPFRLLKFRTMVAGAEGMVDTLLDLNEATGPLFKIKDDPRITPVGKVLRKWSLDELPQLINVARGDMSLVGPRPPLAKEVADYEEWMMSRLEVRPGITGLWQVSGRSDLPFEEYVRLDLFYIENWSLAYDLFILAKTIPIVLSAKGAS